MTHTLPHELNVWAAGLTCYKVQEGLQQMRAKLQEMRKRAVSGEQGTGQLNTEFMQKVDNILDRFPIPDSCQ